MDDTRDRGNSRQLFALVTAVAVVAVGLVAFIVTRGGDLPPANPGYSVSVDTGVTPTTTADRAAAIARHYLDLQTPELAAPEIHTDPIVRSVSAVRAADAPALEPRVPADAVAAEPSRVVWVASVTGDFLNLNDLPWSRAGDPYPSGNIVIDDATGRILGVYPGGPGPTSAGGPTSATPTVGRLGQALALSAGRTLR